MPDSGLQAGIVLIDGRILNNESVLPAFQDYLEGLFAGIGSPLLGVLLIGSGRGDVTEELLDRCRVIFGRSVNMLAALALDSKPRQRKVWANNVSIGLGVLLARIPFKNLNVGVWAYVESPWLYGQPLELVYWVLFFAGLNPRFMRRILYFCDRLIECPAHRDAPIVMLEKKKHREILLMSLATMHFGVANTPYTIAKTIEERLGANRYGTADSLRKTISYILQMAADCCLVNPEEEGPEAYSITPFGEVLMEALTSEYLKCHIASSTALRYAEGLQAERG
jgi:hypothetical protein